MSHGLQGEGLGNYVGQLLDCLGIRQPSGVKGDEEDGEGPKDSAKTGGGLGAAVSAARQLRKSSGGNYYERTLHTEKNVQ